MWKPRESWHRHVQLVGGKAKDCEQYTPDLIAAILTGIADELAAKRMLIRGHIGLVVNEEERRSGRRMRRTMTYRVHA